MADNKTFLEIEIDTKKAQKELADLKRHAAELDTEFQSGAVTEEEYTRSMKVMQTEADALTKVIKDNKVEMQANQREIFAAKGSYNQLSAEYTRLKNEINSLDPHSERWKELSEQAKNVYSQMNELQKATGKYTLQVGNYELATKGLTNAFKQEYAATGSVKSGLAAVGKEMKALVANPLGIAIMAIVTAFEAFKTVLNSTAEGQEKWAKATGTVKGALLGIKEVLLQVAPLLADFFSGNWSELKKDWQATKDAFTNILNVAQETGAIAEERQKLIREEAKMKKQVAEYDKQLADLEGKIKTLKKQGLDTSKAQEEIERINTLRYDEQIKIAQKKYDLKKKENSLTSSTAEDLAEEMELETEITRLQTQKQQYLNGLIKYQEVAKKNTEKEKDNTKEINKLLEERQKLLISIADAEKALSDYINPDDTDRRLKDEEKAYQEALNNIGAMQLEHTDEIIELQKQAEERHKQNVLAIEKEIADEKDKKRQEQADKDKKATEDKIKLAQKERDAKVGATNDVMKAIEEFSSVNASNSKAQFELNKKLQYAQTVMEGARAEIKVFTGEGSFYEKAAQAVAVAISTAASLNKISNTSFSSSSASTSSTANTTGNVTNTILQRYTRQDEIAESRTVLVVDEVTAKQTQIKNNQKLAVV